VPAVALTVRVDVADVVVEDIVMLEGLTDIEGPFGDEDVVRPIVPLKPLWFVRVIVEVADIP
jgi:hypothetical protein